jgi:sialate O-acetylesterase
MPVFSRRFWSRTTFLLLISAAQLASAQGPAGGTSQKPITLRTPAAHQVFQRDANGLADIPLVLPADVKDARIESAQLIGIGAVPGRLVDGKLVGVPTGGPYQVAGRVEIKGQPLQSFQVGPFFVGDLWVLAGQSNMQGVGDLVDVTPPNALVYNLGMDGKWGQAVEPLHWLLDSPDPVHSGDPATRAKRAEDEHKTRTKGTGLGLPFAVTMVEATNVPVGLVSCAHGGTSMAQWDPKKKGDGGISLYGSMLRQVALAGGKVKGVLWYQGESDSMGGQPLADAFAKSFSDFIAAVRADFGQPELPFYYVQIGRFVNPADPKPWNTVQDAQRRLVDEVPNTAVVSVIDLELDDGIHVGTAGLKRVGRRLAEVALREQFGQSGGTTPTLDRVFKGANNTLVVKFKGVNRSSQPVANPGGGMMGPGAMMGMADPRAAGASARRPAGLRPDRHIAGFSIRNAEGKEIPLIYEAMVGTSRDSVVLKLNSSIPAGASLWYGWGLDPYCNLTDTLDMSVPVFGPIALDSIK